MDGRRLTQLREQHQISQAKLYRLSGVSRATIQRIENNEVEPSNKNLQALAAVFGMTVSELTGEQADHTEGINRHPELTNKFRQLIDDLPDNDELLKLLEKIIDRELKRAGG